MLRRLNLEKSRIQVDEHACISHLRFADDIVNSSELYKELYKEWLTGSTQKARSYGQK